uniref:Chitin-binding type-2 domain-containing protein n=1 Tax=Anopheles atroparvus TaxID=41427 RepID=A0A182JCS9_ANOAO
MERVKCPSADSVELVCSQSDDFFYTVPGTRCSAYYRCHQTQPVRFRCTEGAMFDFYQQKCVRSDGTCYEAICSGKTNGVYSDTSQACHRSYRCRGGSMISMETCPPGQLFDGAACVPQDRVVCEGPEATSASFQYEADPRCYGLPDGNHLLPGGDAKDCKKFLRCEANQVLDVFECPPGYHFDARTARCAFIEGDHHSTCHPSEQDELDLSNGACSFLPDGLHLAATSRDCRAYIECRSRQQTDRHECSPLTVFNGQQCVPSFLYHCPRLDPSGDICHLRHDGFHVDPRKGCAYYVRCEGQRTVEEYSCPYGFHYDATGSGSCLENDHLGSVTNAACHRVPYSADCAQRASGYYQDFESNDCNGYFHCHNGAKTSLRCSPGQAFDGENCVPQAGYRCPADDVDSCRGKPNGYHKDARAGCRAYHLCSEGNKISYLCAPGQLFSEGKCRPRVANSDDQCADDSVCAGRPDGYYPDRESQCRRYFFCQRGEKLQTLTCRGSKIFDGRSCVSKEAYSCPAGPTADDVDAAASENCIARSCEPSCARGGFHADYDTGCEQYFFCIDGKQSTLSCSADYVFNGEICVPRGSYYCPRYCTPPESC